MTVGSSKSRYPGGTFFILTALMVIPSLICLLIIRNKMIVIEKEGIVVYIIYLMCVNKSVPTMAGAKLVVSERGDILSPK